MKDTERLDYLIINRATVVKCLSEEKYWVEWSNGQNASGIHECQWEDYDSPREAIDAAMKVHMSQKPENSDTFGKRVPGSDE